MNTLIMAHSPKECEQIANLRQSIKLGKTLPKRYVTDIDNFEPFKVLKYCNKNKSESDCFMRKGSQIGCFENIIYNWDNEDLPEIDLNQKVIGEYIVEKIDEYNKMPTFINGGWCDEGEYNIKEKDLEKTCLDYSEILDYGNDEKKGIYKPLYFYHISHLKIYDEPRELGEYRTPRDCQNCTHNDCYYCDSKPITHAPQSFVYCEDKEV